MKKLLSSIVGLAMALVLSSCFEFETEITVNKDGSGTITEETVFGEQMIGMLEMAAAQGGGGAGGGQNPLADLKDEAKAKAKAAAYGEGVTFDKIEEIKRNGGKGVRITYKFTDINKVTFNPSGAMSNLPGSGSKEVERVKEEEAKFQFADGKLTIVLPEMDEDAKEGAEESGEDNGLDPNDPQAAMMMEMLKGMKVSAKVTVAPEIAETNATHRKGNTVTLFEMNFDEIMKNPDGLKSLQKLDMKDRAKAADALTKVKGVKAETKEKVTITIK
ncbi:hypothetical protein V2O64_14670 [Verrucomicrobiaceae bacterium 227]